jgi:hypothetical protein
VFPDKDVQDAWADEVERRIEAIESGRAETIPADEAITRAARCNQMIPSVSREAELELTDAAKYYAEEAGKDIGLALIEEFESAVQLLCERSQLGGMWRNRRRLPLQQGCES